MRNSIIASLAALLIAAPLAFATTFNTTSQDYPVTINLLPSSPTPTPTPGGCSVDISSPTKGATVTGIVTVKLDETNCSNSPYSRIFVQGPGWGQTYDFIGTTFNWDSSVAPKEKMQISAYTYSDAKRTQLTSAYFNQTIFVQ